MNEAHKVIKYVSIAVAIFLAFWIISGIVTGVFAILGISSIIDFANNNIETINYTKEYIGIDSIELDIAAIELEIQNSDVLKIEGTDIPSDYTFDTQDRTLKIKNKKVAQNSKLVIYIPSDVVKLDIDIGAGKIEMENVKIDKLSLDTGAATAKMKDLTVISQADIDTGIGEIFIENADISNLDLDAGIGNVEYSGYLRGANDVDCGVGSVNINLTGTEAMYKIIAERGIGELNINGNSLSGTQTIGEGSNILKLSGGIGSLNIAY